MLAEAKPNRTIDGLRPWAFDHDPESAIAFCSDALGREVLPFAQAIGQDLMACFMADQPSSLPVVVINPWASDRSGTIQRTFPDFDAWLVYAKEVSEAVLADEREESDGD
jgi:hypothetical protein